MVVKKGINNPRGDIGEANAYTTSQVIIWERANFLYGEDFVPFDASWYAQYDWKWSFAPAKLVLPVSEIPNLEPSTQLLATVEEALSECRDPQEDNRVIHFADQIANATFGARRWWSCRRRRRWRRRWRWRNYYNLLSLLQFLQLVGTVTGGGAYNAGATATVTAL